MSPSHTVSLGSSVLWGKRTENWSVNLLFTLSGGGLARFLVAMRSLTFLLMPVTMMLLCTSVAAQTAPYSGARSQATASACIISAETVRFGDLSQQKVARQASDGKGRHVFPLARTLGAVSRGDQPHVIVTEFH
jgi:hypothetical protein